MFNKPDPRPGKEMTCGAPDTVVRQTIVLGVHMVTGMIGGDPNDPQLADFPSSIKIEIVKEQPA